MAFSVGGVSVRDAYVVASDAELTLQQKMLILAAYQEVVFIQAHDVNKIEERIKSDWRINRKGLQRADKSSSFTMLVDDGDLKADLFHGSQTSTPNNTPAEESEEQE